MKYKKYHLFRRYILLFCISVGTIAIFSYYWYRDEKLVFRVLVDQTIRDFFVNTPGCQIPAWNPWDDSVKSIFEPISGPYRCPGPPSILYVLPNAKISLDNTFIQYYYETEPQNISCSYQVIERDSSILDESIDSRITFSEPRNLKFDVPLGVDFVTTLCQMNKSGASPKTFQDFLPLTPLKNLTKERSIYKANSPNILFLGIDSISNLNFLRHFPKCKKYLSNFLSPITLRGYTKVGDNTFPNLMPLLTGHFYQHYYDEVHNKSMFFDDVDFLWKEFSARGYRTLLAEDAPNIATFNFYRNGFKNPPTDYYYRPFALALENSDLRKGKPMCFGNKLEMEVVYDYLKSFVDTMEARPFFAFVFLARLTHDYFNYAGYADEPTFQLLRYLNDRGVFENTLMVFFSDHGIRYGAIRKTYIGQFEERMPFVHLVLPRWFSRRYPTFYNNLKTNSARLTTPFDLHATLVHLLGIVSGDRQVGATRGLGASLFEEVSPNRTCSQAGITPHWCPCQIRMPVPVDDASVVEAAKAVVLAINNLTQSHRSKCYALELDGVLDARMNEDGRQQENSSTIADYLLVLSASPGGGIFEATVHCDIAKDACSVPDDISRINEYGRQSICVSNVVLQKFCYCK